MLKNSSPRLGPKSRIGSILERPQLSANDPVVCDKRILTKAVGLNNFSFLFEKNETVFLIVAALLSIPMVLLFMKAGRELLQEPPPNPPAPKADQRKDA